MSLHLLPAAVVWAALWYVIGAATGATVQHHPLTRETVMQVREAKRFLVRAQSWLDNKLSIIIAVVLLTAAAQYGYTQYQHAGDVKRIAAATARAESSAADVKRLSQCVATYADKLNASLRPTRRATHRLQSADERFNDALLRLLNDALVVRPDPSRNKADAVAVKHASQHKKDVADELNNERKTRPYPLPPKEVCPHE
jgi:hypothetical protein